MRANERASARRATAALRLWLLARARSSYWFSSGSLKRVHHAPFATPSFGAASRQGAGACQFCGTSTCGFSYLGSRANRGAEASTSNHAKDCFTALCHLGEIVAVA